MVKVYRLMFNFVCCQHSLFAHQTVRTASVLRLTSAAQAGEPFGFVLHSLFAHQTVRTASVLRLTSAAQAGEAFGFVQHSLFAPQTARLCRASFDVRCSSWRSLRLCRYRFHFSVFILSFSESSAAGMRQGKR